MDLIERPAEFVRRHPWEVARARFFLRLLERLGCLATTAAWLDVGAGDAWFAGQLRAVLPATARLVCWDVHYGDAELSSPGPEHANIVFTAERPPGAFDGVMMLDVIEHVEDDVAFVRDVVRDSLTESGWVLVSVPAYQGLFSDHDRALEALPPLLTPSPAHHLGVGGPHRGRPRRAVPRPVARARRHGPARAAAPGPSSPGRSGGMARLGTAVTGHRLRPRQRGPDVTGHGDPELPAPARPEHVGVVPAGGPPGRRS